MKSAVVAITIVVVALSVGIPTVRTAQKSRDFKAKYEEFIFEADQLANLTSYGVNKSDFTRQFARVEAKWNAVPTGGFRDGSYRKFYDSISKWREVVRYWDFDSAWMRDQVPTRMNEASARFNEAKRTMR